MGGLGRGKKVFAVRVGKEAVKLQNRGKPQTGPHDQCKMSGADEKTWTLSIIVVYLRVLDSQQSQMPEYFGGLRLGHMQ